jgi:hypothetical protein
MQWPRWKRKLPCNRTEGRDDPHATAGPSGCNPGLAPPPNTPNPLQEERDLKGSEITLARRWASAMWVARRGMALLSLIWIMLPHELRDLLINTVQG